MTLKWWNDSSHIDSDCKTNLLGEMNQTLKLETCDQGVSMTASLWTVCVQDNPLLSLNALSVGLRQRSTQTNTAVERKYFHCDVPPQADTRKILSGGSPPIHTDTHITCSSISLATFHPKCLWLCENPCVCVLWIRHPLLYTLRDRCIQWFTYSRGATSIVYVCAPKQSQRPHTHLQIQHTPMLDHSRSQPHAHTSSCWPWLTPLKSSCSNSCSPLFPDLHRNQSLAVIGSRSAFLLGKEECSEKEGRETEGGRVKEKEREGGAMVWSWSRVGIFNNKH